MAKSNYKNIQVGEIWTCHEGTKLRPVLVIQDSLVSLEVDFNITRITSQSPKNEYDVEIVDWKQAGLDKPSYVRCAKVQTVNQLELKRRIGTLSERDLSTVLEMVIKHFQRGFDKIKGDK